MSAILAAMLLKCISFAWKINLFYWPFQGGTSFVDLLCFFCLVFAMCLYVPCGHLLENGWPLGSCLWCLTSSLSFSHWYPGSGVVLDYIDSWSLHPYLLLYIWMLIERNTCINKIKGWRKHTHTHNQNILPLKMRSAHYAQYARAVWKMYTFKGDHIMLRYCFPVLHGTALNTFGSKFFLLREIPIWKRV